MDFDCDNQVFQPNDVYRRIYLKCLGDMMSFEEVEKLHGDLDSDFENKGNGLFAICSG